METFNDDEIIAEFVVESKEHLADVESKLLAIEAAGADVDLDLVNEVFRAVHSIKGAAGFLGFATLGQLAHELENILNRIRNRELIPDASVTNAMLKASDTLSAMIEDIQHSNEVDISEQLAALEKIVAGELAEDRVATTGAGTNTNMGAEKGAEAVPADTPEKSSNKGKSSSRRSAKASTPKATADSADEPSGEPVAKTPRKRSRKTNGKTTRKTARKTTETASRKPTARSAEKAANNTQDLSEKTTSAVSAEGTKQAESVSTPAPSAKPPVNTGRSQASGSNTKMSIRVAVGVLDRLMNLAGELVLARNQLLQAVASTNSGSLDGVAARLDQVTSELHEAIMQARMQPVGTVFNKFPRVVRDLSSTLQKQCQLKVEGSEVELDKSIIEAIGDPLTHLVRNAVDHGIESPDRRVAAGKPAVGTITLRAFHQAGKVNISISDDGAGIDVAKLKEKAVSRGLLTPEQIAEMSDREALRLIFHPGFSTAEKVTDVSGRGVGMDVVKTNIEKLGGTVDIETQVGRGTTIHVKLPLTLAIVPSLIVRCGKGRFAIPQTNIRELVRIKRRDGAKRIERVKDAEVLRLRGKLLPLVRLCKALGVDRAAEQHERSAVTIVVVEAGHLQYGLIVDGLHDSEEIVVKPLGRHMQNSRILAGATILGDGQVALILDVTGIASHCKLALPKDEEQVGDQESADDSSVDIQTSLLVTNHPDEQFAIPMEAISRMERVRTDQIDSVGGLDVLQYRGTSLPLLSLEKYIHAKPRAETSKVYIVVFSVLNREVGLIVPHLVDIRKISTEVDMVTFREPGVIGSVEIDGRATRLLDLYELTKRAHPEWFTEENNTGVADAVGPASLQQGESPKPLILLAEDSTFFRKQVAGYLEEAGYEVIACEDGQIAWHTLQERGEDFDVVVTDIEMPNMDGCQLAQHIKGDPSLSHLPIIALTSLAGEDDMQRGMESGIDDYQVKLDRERLMAAVARYLREGAARRLRDSTSGTDGQGGTAAVGRRSQP